jgi:predicted RNase H-like HicB family nuclease
MKKYLVVVEKTETGYSAYSPDLEGCVATGHSREEVEREMQEAIEFHLDGLAMGSQFQSRALIRDTWKFQLFDRVPPGFRVDPFDP